MKLSKLQVKQDGKYVWIVLNDDTILHLEWKAALEMGSAITAVARKAEEFDRAPEIIFDNAVLIRAGAPFGLSNDPRILAEAVKEAQHNKDIRRSNMGSIKSEAVVGTPNVIKTP